GGGCGRRCRCVVRAPRDGLDQRDRQLHRRSLPGLLADAAAARGGPVRMSRRDLFRSRSVVSLLAAEVVSTTGSQMTWLALPWFVLVTTGSATKMSFVVAAELLGVAALGMPGGRLLGRLGARRTMLLCDGARPPPM